MATGDVPNASDAAVIEDQAPGQAVDEEIERLLRDKVENYAPR